MLCAICCVFCFVLFYTLLDCFLNGFMRCFERLFHMYMKLLLICYFAVKEVQIQTSLGSKLWCLVKFSFFLSWELWSQVISFPIGSAFLQPVVKNATTENKAWYLTCPLKCHGDLTFSHHFHSWQLSSIVLQNRSKRLEKVHVVLGNKPCDLDSLISTLTYAYFLDKVMEKLDWVVLIHSFQSVTDILLLSQLL